MIVQGDKEEFDFWFLKFQLPNSSNFKGVWFCKTDNESYMDAGNEFKEYWYILYR